MLLPIILQYQTELGLRICISETGHSDWSVPGDTVLPGMHLVADPPFCLVSLSAVIFLTFTPTKNIINPYQPGVPFLGTI